MKKIILLLALSFSSITTFAAEYKCYASKYQRDMAHFFSDGYVVLSVKKKSVRLEYYNVNKVARRTSLEIEAKYDFKGVQGGNGQVKDLVIGTLDRNDHTFPGDTIDTMYFDQSLLANDDPQSSGVVGKFAFTGEGFSYDWNVCYNF